jgi:anti-sigma factor RsiW
MNECNENQTRIQLYVDGELTLEERDDFLAHVEHCLTCSVALEEAKAQSAYIRGARYSVSAPDSLRNAVTLKLQDAARAGSGPRIVQRNSSRMRVWSWAAVAAMLLVVAGGVLAFNQHRQKKNNPMIQTAVLAHQQLERSETPLDISSDSAEVVSSWFANKMSFPFQMANSGIATEDKAKYKLNGGRLLTIGSERVALLSFTQSHNIVSMLVGPDRLLKASGGTTVESDGIVLHSQRRQSFHVVTWNTRGLSYVLTYRSPVDSKGNCSKCHEGASENQSTEISSVLKVRLQ